jgi:hypothetical protein
LQSLDCRPDSRGSLIRVICGAVYYLQSKVACAWRRQFPSQLGGDVFHFRFV